MAAHAGGRGFRSLSGGQFGADVIAFAAVVLPIFKKRRAHRVLKFRA